MVSRERFGELSGVVASALVKYGPDGHMDGFEIITLLLLEELGCEVDAEVSRIIHSRGHLDEW